MFIRRLYAWIFAGVAVLVATLIELVLYEVFVPNPFLTFYAAAAVSTAYSGLWPGVFATMLSAVVVNFIFLPPHLGFSLTPLDVARTGFFVLVSGLTHWLFVERQQAIQRLFEIETLLDTMIESAADYAIFSMDTGGHVLRWNTGAQRLFGYSESEILGEDIALIFTPEDREKGVPQKELRDACEFGCAEDERWHLRKDGSRFFVSGVVRPMIDHRQRHIGYIKIARDVTGRELVEKERTELLLREQTARLQAERASGLLRQFTAIVVHELRNPIATIKGFTTTLFDREFPWREEDRQNALEIMDQEADKLTDLVDHLLDLSQIQAGTLRIQRQPSTIQEVVDTAHAQLLAITPNHRLSLDIPENLPEVDVDPNRVAQVIVNLVGNAVKFSPPDTRIDVTAKRVPDFVQIEVRDEGPGIPPDKRDLIFEAFRQLSSDQFTRKSGIGVGLFICKTIVEAHGGTIWIVDQAPPGTTFAFTLPVV